MSKLGRYFRKQSQYDSGTRLISSRSHECIQEQGDQRPRFTCGNADQFHQITVVYETSEGMFSSVLNLVKIFDYQISRRKGLRQGPLKGIVPQVCGETAAGLLNGCGTPQDQFTD